MKFRLYHGIILALFFGALWGWIINTLYADKIIDMEIGSHWSVRFVAVADFLGATFIKALKMIIVPLIFSSVVCGTIELGGADNFGRLGLKTIVYYICTSLVAASIGLAAVNLLKPGVKDGKANENLVKLIQSEDEQIMAKGKESAFYALEKSKDKEPLGVFSYLVRSMIPANIFKAASDNGAMLALIFLSLLTAFALLKTGNNEGSRQLILLIKGVNEISGQIVNWIMLFAPLGIFGLICKTVALSGFDLLKDLLLYFITVILALSVHFFIILPGILLFLGRVSPWRHLLNMRDALLTAFSTASSSATLPVSLQCAREKAGVSTRVSGFTMSLGATVNMDGTALYECVAVIFIAQVMGYELSLASQFVVVIMALLTSIGVPGVPSASLVAIVLIINNLGIRGAEAIVGAIYAVDRILDMSRTAVNVYSDSCGALVIARSEGELTK